MPKGVLDYMVEENQFPIVFIGAGISQRYLEGYPNWQQLLKMLWKEAQQTRDFYGHLNRIRNSLASNQLSDAELEYLTNVTAAADIERMINELFYKEKIEIIGFSQEQAFKSKLSPFKKMLSNFFLNYKLKKDIDEEFEQFKKMLMKAQIILTTNYDTLIQDSYNEISKHGVKTYVGQTGFFQQTIGFAELYKLHGCAREPQSLIITEEDYSKFDKNSVLISAKIISMLLYSPIIFIGYSLTDRNVRKIIKEFVSSLTDEETVLLENRLVVIEWKENEKELIEEKITDNDLNCRFTVIKTDNYIEVYKKIAKINQGVAPSEVRRYQHVIRNLIVERGKEGTLNSLLIAPKQLDDLERVTDNKNLIVAIGDNTVIFAMPDLLTYVDDYLNEKKELTSDIILRFLASQNPKARLPFVKYVTIDSINNSNLHQNEKDKLRSRLRKQGNYGEQKKLIAVTYRIRHKSLKQILSSELSIDRQQEIISYNLDNINLNEVEDYIKNKLKEIKEKGEYSISTPLRRLILLYDLKKNGTCE